MGNTTDKWKNYTSATHRRIAEAERPAQRKPKPKAQKAAAGPAYKPKQKHVDARAEAIRKQQAADRAAIAAMRKKR